MSNSIALDLIARHEGCRLEAYQNSGPHRIWTVGYGATGKDITRGTVWTQAQADADLRVRVDKLESDIRRKIMEAKGPVPTTEQMAAFDSFAYNLGLETLATSHLMQCFIYGDYLGCAKAFQNYDHAGGKELRGLLIRRLDEAQLFLKGS